MGQESVGELIRHLRVQAGLSQQALAGTEYTASYVSMIESGKRKPTEEALVLFARRLGCSLGDLQPGADLARAELELSYARWALANGEPPVARARLEDVLARAGLPLRVEHEGLLLLAETYERANDYHAAIRALNRLWEAALAGQTPVPVTEISNRLCSLYVLSGDFDAAVRVGEQGLRASVQAGLHLTRDHLKQQATLVAAHLQLGNLTLAGGIADELITASREAGSAFGEGAAYWNAALVAEARGRPEEAVRLAQRALALLSEEGDALAERNLMQLTWTAAELILAADAQRAGEAGRLLDRSLPTVRELGGTWDLGNWEATRAIAHQLTGDCRASERLARQALTHLGPHERIETANALITLGDALVGQGDLAGGVASYQEAAGQLPEALPAWKRANVARAIAYRMTLADRRDDAVRLLELALDAHGVLERRAHADVAFGRRPPVISEVGNAEAGCAEVSVEVGSAEVVGAEVVGAEVVGAEVVGAEVGSAEVGSAEAGNAEVASHPTTPSAGGEVLAARVRNTASQAPSW